MNKARRNEIAGAIVQLEAIREQVNALREEIERIRDEEQDYFDNMPEPFQYGDRGVAAEEAIAQLDGAIDEVDIFGIDSVIEYLETAAA